MPPWKYKLFGSKRKDRYDAEILYFDTITKDFFNKLKKNKLLKNTWIIITADHGEEFGEHGRKMGHGRTLYSEVLRVPLIFYNKDVTKEERKIKSRVRLIDLAPTVLDLAGIPKPKLIDGVSLKREITEKVLTESGDLQAISQVGLNDLIKNKNLISIIDGDYKYIHDSISGKEELYNLENDPKERINLAKSAPETLAEFRKIRDNYMSTKRLAIKRVVPDDEFNKELKEQLRSIGYLQ